jgi:amino acid transporter/mannitol/fructose-specific phosphotransferase system IIA component (Ntr-type)
MAAAPPQPGALRKDISLFGVFAIALGTTISSGFFLLPGMAFAEVGPAVIVSYLLAGLVVLPPILCKAELATAMPRAGGVYFYIDRCFGPLAGTVAGVGTWIALTLKTSFALVGSGYYLGLFIPDPPVILIAVVLAVAFGTLNMFGVGKTTKLQAMLVVAILVLLAWFVGWGASDIDASHFDGFWGKGGETVISMVGVVLISYMGLTKVVSVAEEIRNPERNIPAGILLALGTAVLIYMAGLAVMVGVVPAEDLASTYTPAALAADVFAGRAGMITISVAAIASFLSVANAGILSASRYPLAMGRDHIFPKVFRRLGRFGTPVPAIFVTVTLIVVEVILLDPIVIAKYAGTLQLLLFATIGAAVIVMRESHLASYDPGFRVPLYPWVPLLGIALCITAVVLLGWPPVLFAVVMIVVSVVWFKLYAASKIDRYGAIFHVFARLGEHRFDPLDTELRGIIKDKGLRPDDPFEKTIARARVIEAPPGIAFEELATLVSEALASDTGRAAEEFHRGFLEGTQVGATPVMGSVALPHLRLAGLRRSHLVLVRCANGMEITVGPGVPGSHSSQDVRALFFMASPEEDPAQHLRLLANLAGAVEQDGFMARWNAAAGPAELKEALLRSEHSLTLTIAPGTLPGAWIGRSIASLGLPDDILVALVYRVGERIIPTGRTVFEAGDRVIVIGKPEHISQLRSDLGLDTTETP